MCGWQGRFDDPERSFRTLYCARDLETALRETLAPLRPPTALVAELTELFGPTSPSIKALGQVRLSELGSRVLAFGAVVAVSDLVDLTDVAVRAHVERENPELLAAHGLDHLDVSAVSSRTRALTQALARGFYEHGASGVRFTSNVDGRPCLALFEGRSRLTATGLTATPLPSARPLIADICAELNLTLLGD